MLSFLYVYSDHSILECYNLFSGVELSMRSFLLFQLQIRESISERFHSISVDTEVSIFHGQLPIKLETITRKNEPSQQPKITVFKLAHKLST